MITYGQATDAIMLALGYDVDDASENRAKIGFNVNLAVAKLNKQRLAKQYSTGDARAASASLLTYIVPITTVDVEDGVFSDWDSKFFYLPTSVYSLDNDGGINFIRYLRNEIPAGCPPAVANTPFTGATLASMNSIYASAYQKPRTDRPYYARSRANTANGLVDRVYLFGVGQGVEHLLVGLYAIADFDTFNWDDPLDIPDELGMTLQKMVIDMGAWALQVPQERTKNDGRDTEPGEIIRTRPQISINDPSNIDA